GGDRVGRGEPRARHGGTGRLRRVDHAGHRPPGAGTDPAGLGPEPGRGASLPTRQVGQRVLARRCAPRAPGHDDEGGARDDGGGGGPRHLSESTPELTAGSRRTPWWRSVAVAPGPPAGARTPRPRPRPG